MLSKLESFPSPNLVITCTLHCIVVSDEKINVLKLSIEITCLN